MSRTIAFGRSPFPSGSYVLEMEETDIFRCFQRNFFLRLIATGEAGILLSSYLLWTTATQNHRRICKFVPLLTAMYLKEEKIPSTRKSQVRGGAAFAIYTILQLKPHNLSGLICAKLRCRLCWASAQLHPPPCFAQIILGNL